MSTRTFISDPHIAALVFLIWDKMEPILEDIRTSIPDDGDPAEWTHWFNGALYGATSALVRSQHDEGDTLDRKEIDKLYDAFGELIDEVWGEEGDGDINAAMMRLVPDAFDGASP